VKLIELKVTNFRGYAVETTVPLEPLTVLVGKNDAGKSSLLDALDIFFNDAPMDHDDCCVATNSSEVRIACVFTDFPGSIVLDEQFATTLQDEHLLRADKSLELVKVYDCSGTKAKAPNVYARALHPTAAGVDDLLALTISQLKARAKDQAVDLKGVNQSIKAQIRQAIWNASSDLKATECDVSLKKETGKDAFEQVEKHLPVYALFKSDRPSTDQDAEAQDPLKAAIKEAVKGREKQLDEVLGIVTAELKRVADKTVRKLKEMSPDLADHLEPTVKTKPWESVFSVSLTGDGDIPINKRGSGTRRLVLLNFFRARAEDASDGKGTGVIYAVEEPETSQHPNYQVMLLDALEQLVEQGDCQILLTTHTPTLARRVDRRCLRLIAKNSGHPSIMFGSDDATLEAIVKTLGVLPDHGVKVFVGVEGKHDISFLRRVSAILAKAEPDIPDLGAAEADGRLVFVPLGGSSLELWITSLAGLHLPEFYLTDRDNPPPQQAKYQKYIDAWGARGCTAWATSKRELENYLHPDVITVIAPTYTSTGDEFEDVPMCVARAIHEAATGAGPWNSLEDRARKRKCSSAKGRLNTECVEKMTPALLTASDPHGDVRMWLRAIGGVLAT
jgi:predicted ATPase